MTESANNSDTVSESAELFCARRGNQWLTKQDLEAHLAAVVRLEHVGVLLGAGASVGGDLGGKTMASLWDDFTSNFPTSASWLESENFVSGGASVNVEALTDSLDPTYPSHFSGYWALRAGTPAPNLFAFNSLASEHYWLSLPMRPEWPLKNRFS